MKNNCEKVILKQKSGHERYYVITLLLPCYFSLAHLTARLNLRFEKATEQVVAVARISNVQVMCCTEIVSNVDELR